MWEQDAPGNVLIPMDGVGGQEGFDLVGFPVVGEHVDGVVELGGEFLPLVEGGVGVDLLHLVLLQVVEGNQVAVLVGAPVAAYQKGAESQFDGIGLAGSVFGGHGVEVDLDGLSNFLVETHAGGDGVGLVVVLFENCGIGKDEEEGSYKDRYFHWDDK